MISNRPTKVYTSEMKKSLDIIGSNMNLGRTDFSNAPSLENIQITPHWLLGLTEGDGSFYVTGQEAPQFSINLNNKEEYLLRAIQGYFKGIGKVVVQGHDKKIRGYLVTKIDDFKNTIIPFYDNLLSNFRTKKVLDYNDWKMVIKIIQTGRHLVSEGKELIKLIAAGMNNNRLSTTQLKTGITSVLLSQDQINAVFAISPFIDELAPGSHADKVNSYLAKEKSHCLTVLYPDGTIFKHFNTKREAAKEMKVAKETINKLLKNKESYKGFIYRLTNELGK